MPGKPDPERRMVGGAVEKLGPYGSAEPECAGPLDPGESLQLSDRDRARRFGEEGGNFAEPGRHPFGWPSSPSASAACGRGRALLGREVFSTRSSTSTTATTRRRIGPGLDQVDMIFEVANEVTWSSACRTRAPAVTAQTAVARMRVTKILSRRRVRRRSPAAWTISSSTSPIAGAARPARTPTWRRSIPSTSAALVQDHEKAKALLAEAGPRGMKLNIDPGRPTPGIRRDAGFKGAGAGGIDLDLNTCRAPYWEVWDRRPLASRPDPPPAGHDNC